VTVSDLQGRFVTGLGPERFQVWEDKLEQKIEYFSQEDVPPSVGVIFDSSGSMKDKASKARDAARTFIAAGNREDEYFLVEFATRPMISATFTTDAARLQNHLIFTPSRGMTALLTRFTSDWKESKTIAMQGRPSCSSQMEKTATAATRFRISKSLRRSRTFRFSRLALSISEHGTVTAARSWRIWSGGHHGRQNQIQ